MSKTTEIITGRDQANPEDTAVTLINPPAAWLDVLAERQRQVSGEGWTPEHDDQHDKGQMAAAAACYAMPGPAGPLALEAFWPWTPEWWKPTDRRRDLIKAAALAIAEIERLDRIRAALECGDA